MFFSCRQDKLSLIHLKLYTLTLRKEQKYIYIYIQSKIAQLNIDEIRLEKKKTFRSYKTITTLFEEASSLVCHCLPWEISVIVPVSVNDHCFKLAHAVNFVKVIPALWVSERMFMIENSFLSSSESLNQVYKVESLGVWLLYFYTSCIMKSLCACVYCCAVWSTSSQSETHPGLLKWVSLPGNDAQEVLRRQHWQGQWWATLSTHIHLSHSLNQEWQPLD